MRVIRYFVRHYPRQSLGVLLCLLLAAATESVGLSTLLPLLSLAIGEPSGAASGYETWVVGGLERVGLERSLGSLLAVVVAALWTKSFLVLLSKRQVGYGVARIATDLRLGLLRALLAARWSYFTRQPVGRTANSMATEADRASYAFDYVALIATYTIEASVYAAVAFAVSWRGTLAAGAAAAGTLWLLSALVRVGARAGRRQTALLGSLLGRLTDALGAVKLLKATGRESSVGPLLADDARLLKRQLKRRVIAKEALRALQEPILGSLLAVGFYTAISWLTIPLSSVLVLALVFTRALIKVNSIQSKYQAMVTEASALWSIVERIRLADEAREPAGGSRAPSLEQGIVFDDIRLHYEGRAVLDGLSLEVPAGRITAVVGPSGSGKTTLTDLVTGLVLPESGSVRIDGVPLEEIDLAAWRRRVGYVPQDLLLLHDSVRHNVSLGDPDLDDAAVEAALRDAGAWRFVSELPGGLDASVGERGTLLSGGQRQRIAIARALVHRPRLLILDEATAALDAESEAAVWRSVAALRGRTTVIAISHQPSLANVADRVYRIENGRAERVAKPGGADPAHEAVA